jgi:hypothetical protein
MAKMPLCILKGRFPIYLALYIFENKVGLSAKPRQEKDKIAENE